MILHETRVAGAFVVELERLADERGWFARSYDAEVFAAHGIDPTVAQCNVSFNERAGTLRGMHYQAEPHGEGKLIRVTRGAIYDVIVDLRPDSRSRGQWIGVELREDSPSTLYAPPGVAHGFQTLADRSEIHYQMTSPYVPGAGRGVRYDDPAFAIDWPPPPPAGRIVSERDLAFPDFAWP